MKLKRTILLAVTAALAMGCDAETEDLQAIPNSEVSESNVAQALSESDQDTDSSEVRASDESEQDQEMAGRRFGRHRGPHQAAFDACAESSRDDECAYVSRRGERIEGTCGTTRHGDGLVCAPENGRIGHGRGERNGPPQAAVDACADSSQGAACTFEGRDGTIAGTCGTCIDGDSLICRPASGRFGLGYDSRGPRGGGPPPVLLEACADSSRGDACTVEGPRGGTVEGVCGASRSGALVCRPAGAGWGRGGGQGRGGGWGRGGGQGRGDGWGRGGGQGRGNGWGHGGRGRRFRGGDGPGW